MGRGLTGRDPLTDLPYVDYSELDARLVRPFIPLFCPDKEHLAVVFFFHQAELYVPGKSGFFKHTQKQVVIVGCNILYVCENDSTILRVLPLIHITHVVMGENRWVGLTVEKAMQVDFLLQFDTPQAAEDFKSVVCRLYHTLKQRDLPVVFQHNIRSFLNLGPLPCVSPSYVKPLSTVRRKDKTPPSSRLGPSTPPCHDELPSAPQSPSSPFPPSVTLGTPPSALRISCADKPEAEGTYLLDSAVFNGRPVWSQKAGQKVIYMEQQGHWAVGVKQAMDKGAGWVMSLARGTHIYPNHVAVCGGWMAFHKETNTWKESGVTCVECAHAEGVIPEAASRLADIAAQQGIAGGEAAQPVSDAPGDGGLAEQEAMFNDLQREAGNLAAKIQLLKSQNEALRAPPGASFDDHLGLTVPQLSVQELQVTEQEQARRLEACKARHAEVMADRNAILNALGVAPPPQTAATIRQAPVAPVAEAAALQHRHDTEAGEQELIRIKGVRDDLQRSVEAAKEERNVLAQQLAAVETVREDSSRQHSIIQSSMAELENRGRALAAAKEKSAAELEAVRGEHRMAIARLMDEMHAKEVEMITKIEAQERRMRELESTIGFLSPSITARRREELQAEVAVATRRYTSLLEEVKQLEDKRRTLCEGEGEEPPVSPSKPGELAETCRALSEMMERYEKARHEAKESGSLRYLLQLKEGQARALDGEVRSAIRKMKNLQQAYESRLAECNMRLRTKELQLAAVEAANVEAAKKTASDIASLEQQKEQMRGYMEEEVKRLREARRKKKEEVERAEERRRWELEQQLLVADCGESPQVSTPQSSEVHSLPDERDSIDTRIHEIDQELLATQREILELDQKEAEIQAKKDEGWRKMVQQEEALRAAYDSSADPATLEALRRVQHNMGQLSESVKTFIAEIRRLRAKAHERDAVLMEERERLVHRCADLRQREAATPDIM